MIELQKLSTEEKIGQMLMVGIGKKSDIPKVINLIKEYKIGGVLLYKNNYSNYQEMIALIKKLKDSNKNNKIPLFIAVDQEGGKVNRMPNEFLNIYSANKLCLTNNLKLITDAATTTALMLKETGINLNLAPVLDIKNFNDDQALGNRCFSEDKNLVATCGVLYMNGLRKNGIIPIVKHFPGHGATQTDSHFLLPIIKNYNKLKDNDLLPFSKAIDENCPGIMVSHMLIKKIDIFPCSLSKKFISKELKNGFNYEGLIVTDDIRMFSIRLLYGKYKAIIKAFFAQNDIVIFKYKEKDSCLIQKIKQKVTPELMREINNHCQKIINIKNLYNLNDNTAYPGCDIKKVNEQIAKINNAVKEKLDLKEE